MISQQDKEVLVRLKDATEKLRYSHCRVLACQYPSKQMGETMIKMGMYLYCSVYSQLSESYRKEYSHLGSYLRELNYILKECYDGKKFALSDYDERLLAVVIEGFEELGI